MKKEVIEENGVVIGTASNKYEMKNPIARYLVSRFDLGIKELLVKASPAAITEVGCGEGHVTQILLEHCDAAIRSMDISDHILELAKHSVAHHERVDFSNKSIYDLDPVHDAADLVVCCEVLEHLEYPLKGLEKLAGIASPYALLSVPREPMFRSMNFLRGAYVSEWGNSPGHIQHWSKRQFVRFVSQKFEILEVLAPIPWTMMLVRTRTD